MQGWYYIMMISIRLCFVFVRLLHYNSVWNPRRTLLGGQVHYLSLIVCLPSLTRMWLTKTSTWTVADKTTIKDAVTCSSLQHPPPHPNSIWIPSWWEICSPTLISYLTESILTINFILLSEKSMGILFCFLHRKEIAKVIVLLAVDLQWFSRSQREREAFFNLLHNHRCQSWFFFLKSHNSLQCWRLGDIISWNQDRVVRRKVALAQ